MFKEAKEMVSFTKTCLGCGTIFRGSRNALLLKMQKETRSSTLEKVKAFGEII